MNYVVFDLETRHLVGEVKNPQTGKLHSWKTIEDLGMCVGCTWSETEGFRDWLEGEALWAHLGGFDLVVGFNSYRFDNQVLRGACGTPLDFPLYPQGVDLLLDVQDALGHRISLRALAEATLGRIKLADAEEAPLLWRQGKMWEVIEYCRGDVALTRDLYLYGLSQGKVHYLDRSDRRKMSLSVRWTRRDAQGKVVGVVLQPEMADVERDRL